VTVYLNRSAYTSPIQATCGIVDATTYLNGSFIAPNLAAGSYWAVSFGWTQNIYTIGNHTANGSTYPNTYVETSGTYLGLISGSGALLTGITSGEIATLEVAINSTITSTMRVPLNELNAAVVAIQGTSALINTSFGQMKTTLNDISASIQSISNGQVYINTSIGKVMTQLTNINAAIARVNGSIIELSTVLGTVNTTLNNLVPIITRISSTTLSINTLAGEINYNLTSFSNLQITTMNNNVIAVEGYINGVNVTMQATLSALNATITSTASNVNSLLGSAATIKTDLGTITGQITTVQSGIATIQTSLGSINVTVNSIKTTGTSNKNSLNISYYFEIVLIVLAALILVFVIMTFIGNRRRP
jgi:chromosome segregation ATPase